MAGDWIKIEHVTPDKPEVVAMADSLAIDQDAVVGKLLRLWIWADQQSHFGNALSVTDSFIDRYTMRSGFASALRSVGWLSGENGKLEFPNFDRHNGQTAKSRALIKKRVEKNRSKNDAKCNAGSVTKSLPEKRREEINTPLPPLAVPASLQTKDFLAAWNAWVEFRTKLKKTKNLSVIFDQQLKWLENFGAVSAAGILTQSMRNGWQGLFELKDNQGGKPNGHTGRKLTDAEMLSAATCGRV